MLILGWRDVLNLGGQQRLILNRASSLNDVYGISTLGLFVTSRKAQRRSGRTTVSGRGYHLVTFGFIGIWDLPVSIMNFIRVAYQWRKNSGLRAVIFSGKKIYPLGLLIRHMFSNIPLILDEDGIIEEAIEYGGPRRTLLDKLLSSLLGLAERAMLRVADGALVVSSGMADYVRKRGCKRTILVNCAVTKENLMDVEKWTAVRERVRATMGWKGKTVFVFSGTMAPWQNLRRSSQLVKRYIDFTGSECILLLLTPQVNDAIMIATESLSREEVFAMTADASEVHRLLCASDVGLVLRDPSLTNAVAFPNKFSEYFAAGLLVITSPGLQDPARILKDNSLGLVVDPEDVCNRDFIDKLKDLVDQRGADLTSYYSRQYRIAWMEVNMDHQISRFADFLGTNRGPYVP